MTMITLLQFALVGALVVYLTLNMTLLIRLPRVSGPLVDHPRVSICIPARNEERTLDSCLTSLVGQDYPDFEIIVVDDQSTDATPQIVEKLSGQHGEIKALTGSPLPEGWYGKPYALHQAVQAATGEILIFADADVVFSSWALRSALYLMQIRQLDLLSLMPGMVFGSFWERAVQPVIFGLIAAKTRFSRIHDPGNETAMGFGAFIMIRREIYDKIGGHQSLRQAILDDIGLARLAKASGARLLVADARDALSIRMYHSLEEIWLGWRKNIFLAFKCSVVRTLVNSAVLLLFLFTPWVLFAVQVFTGNVGVEMVISMATLMLVITASSTLCSQLKLSWPNLFLFPLGAWVAVAVILNSMFHRLTSGGATWRGRVYKAPSH